MCPHTENKSIILETIAPNQTTKQLSKVRYLAVLCSKASTRSDNSSRWLRPLLPPGGFCRKFTMAGSCCPSCSSDMHFRRNLHTHTCTHKHRQKHMHTYTCMVTCMHRHTNTYTCTCIHTHTHTHTHKHTHTHTQTHMHTHTHTHTETYARTHADWDRESERRKRGNHSFSNVRV